MMHHKTFTPILLLTVIFVSCSDKYLAFKNQYQFKNQDGKPDYSNLDFWAAHPWKWDPSDSIPKPIRNEPRDSSVDVFFLHPTTFTKKQKIKKPNADIDDDYINVKTDYSTILFQASVFNGSSRVFAPRYRQAHFSNFFEKDSVIKQNAFDIAYYDLKEAFEFYLAHYNNGRPIIIAGHSQGSLLAERLLNEFFNGQALQQKLVVAYIIGWTIPKEYFTSLKMCGDSVQTGCICGWRTFRKGYIPSYIKKENGNSFVTNPLTWTTGDEYAGKKSNKGSVLTKFNKVYRATTDAKINSGVLWVKKPKFPWGFLYSTRNYHIADINLFYINMRENIKLRIIRYYENIKP